VCGPLHAGRSLALSDLPPPRLCQYARTESGIPLWLPTSVPEVGPRSGIETLIVRRLPRRLSRYECAAAEHNSAKVSETTVFETLAD
jgi:hypothetical protein